MSGIQQYQNLKKSLVSFAAAFLQMSQNRLISLIYLPSAYDVRAKGQSCHLICLVASLKLSTHVRPQYPLLLKLSLSDLSLLEKTGRDFQMSPRPEFLQ